LTRSRDALVADFPGLTRDRQYGRVKRGDLDCLVVDTGGIVEGCTGIEDQAVRQVNYAIEEADLILFLVDAREGLSASDLTIAQQLRKTNKPVLLVINKIDGIDANLAGAEFHAMGLGEVVSIAASHGRGVVELLRRIDTLLPKAEAPSEEKPQGIAIAVVGRPNVGKSTLVNKLMGEERVIVSPIAGTTRDAIDSKIRWHGQEFTLIDTAGIRKRGKIDPGIERYSVLRAMKALKRADVVLILLDAEQGIIAQDAHVAGMITQETAGALVLVNKWDAVKKDSYTIHEYTDKVRQDLKFLPYMPVLFISALTGQRVSNILPHVVNVNEARYQRISTSELNKFMRDAITQHPPPGKGGRRAKFFFATQASVAPPTFVFFVNNPQSVNFGYKRFLENRLRERWPFTGVPIRLFFRARSEDRFGK